MGQKNSKNEQLHNERIYCSIDMEMLPVKQFKALGCGHCFCNECLEAWGTQRLLYCPKCRYEERRSVSNLSDLYNHEGPLFIDESPDKDDHLEIKEMLHLQMVRRGTTIKIFRQAADAVTEIELTTAGVKIGGAAAGLVGTGMVITGGILSLTGVGAVAGVPLAMAGAAVGGAGGLTVGGGIIGEMVAKKKELSGANEHLQNDYFRSMQLRILIGRAALNEEFAQKFNIPSQDAASFIGILGRTAKFGVATANLVRSMAIGVARGAGTAGLHVAGIAISAVLIPIDIFQMIQSSIRVHKKEKAEIAKDLESIASKLETELIPVLKERGYRLTEIERYDNEKNKHTLMLAIEESVYESVIVNSNLSMEEIEKKHVILLDILGDVLDAEAYQNVIDKWTSSNLLEDDSDDSDNSEYNEEEEFELVDE